MQWIKELGEVIEMLRAAGAAGADKLRGELGEILNGVQDINERTAMHNAHVLVGDALRQGINEVPGFANYLFGAEAAGKVGIGETCHATGPSASVRLTPNVGTHDVLVNIVRVPKNGSGLREGMTLDRVERAMGMLDDRREAYDNAAKLADTIGLRERLGAAIDRDGEMYADVSECLLFLRQLLSKEASSAE